MNPQTYPPYDDRFWVEKNPWITTIGLLTTGTAMTFTWKKAISPLYHIKHAQFKRWNNRRFCRHVQHIASNPEYMNRMPNPLVKRYYEVANAELKRAENSGREVYIQEYMDANFLAEEGLKSLSNSGPEGKRAVVSEEEKRARRRRVVGWDPVG